MNVEYIKKNDFNEEVNNIKKKEQELYKFILQQFLGLEDFKEKISDQISDYIDKRCNFNTLEEKINNLLEDHISKKLSTTDESLKSKLNDFNNVLKNNTNDIILESIENNSINFRGEKGEQGNRGEKGEQGNRGEKGEQGDRGKQGDRGERGDIGEQGESFDISLLNNFITKEFFNSEISSISSKLTQVKTINVSNNIEGDDEKTDEENDEENSINNYLTLESDTDLNSNKFDNIFEEYDTITIFLNSEESNNKLILRKPSEDIINTQILIANSNNTQWKISTNKECKIGSQFEKNILKYNQSLRIISNGENYLVI